MHNPTLGYALLAILVTTIVLIAVLHWRYARYLKIKRSGTGRKAVRVWKPFWYK